MYLLPMVYHEHELLHQQLDGMDHVYLHLDNI
jgi:hypothetical protein